MVKNLAANIFNEAIEGKDLESQDIWSQYLKVIMEKNNFPDEFNTTQTVELFDELGIVLETDNPKEIALNIGRINTLTSATLKNDLLLGYQEVVHVYLEQAVLARNLRKAYHKPNIMESDYTIRETAFDERDTFNKTVIRELKNAYPKHVEAMRRFEKIFEEAAEKSIEKSRGYLNLTGF